MISNPSNPSTDEIKEWAYSDQDEPHQEWELFLLWKGEFDEYLSFASDINCPKEDFFLNLLYYWIWRVSNNSANENELDAYPKIFEQAKSINTPYVKLWLQRSKDLLSGKTEIDQSSWWKKRRPFDDTL